MRVVDKCSACKGHVVEEETQEFDPRSGPAIIGPGSMSQYTTITSYYCADCGLVYKAPPSVMQKRRKAHGVIVSVDSEPLLKKAQGRSTKK